MQCANKLLLQKKVLKNRINFKIKNNIINKPFLIINYKKNYQIYHNLSFFLNNYNYFSFFSYSLFEVFKNYNFLLTVNKYNNFLVLINKKKISYKLVKNISEENKTNFQKINNKQYFFYNILKTYCNFTKEWKQFEKYNRIILIKYCRNNLIKYFLQTYKYTFKILYKKFYNNLILKRIYLF